MKTLLTVSLFAVLALNLTSCSTPEERRRREAQRAREDAQWEAERRQRDREYARIEGERDAADFQDYLVGFARSLGKTPAELTAAERAEARREYDDRYGSGGWHHHFWY